MMGFNLMLDILSHVQPRAIQEAPLTLRGQRDRCRNIKGKPQIFGSFHYPRRRPLFSLGVVFGGPWQTQVLYTKFEVPSFSHCVNIKVEPQNFGKFPWPRAMPIFPLGVIL